MRRKKARNEKCDTGTNAAAFFRHFDRDTRDGKLKSVPQDGSSHRPENEIGDFGRTFLQRMNGPIQNHIRERNHEQKKHQRKSPARNAANP